MGLDMYFTVKRAFLPETPEAERILSAAQTTLGELQRLAALDPHEHETAMYLGRWNFGGRLDGTKKDEETLLGEAVEEAAGLLDFATEHSSGGELAWKDGAIIVSITCIYWRKANQVHGWFVENCQGGEDDCGEYEVHAEQLAQLRSECSKALECYEAGNLESARDIMPPTPGFFFGAYEIDEWFAQDLKHTISEVERVILLATKLRGGVSWWYHSSW